MQQYDPMADFWKKGIDFLFRQTPAIVICFIACSVLYNEMIRRDNEGKAEIARINSEWSISLNDTRKHLQMCEEQRVALAIEVEKLKVRFEKYIKK